MAEYRRDKHTVYNITYHYVWATKYRYQVNMHFGTGTCKVSAFNSPNGMIVGKSLNDVFKRIRNKHGLLPEQIILEFQPEN